MLDPEHHTMSFGDHLEELRRRLIVALAPLLPLAVVLFYFSDTIIAWLRLPLVNALLTHDLSPMLQVLGPAEVVLMQLKLAVIAALIIAAPWVLYQAWLFIAPGLYLHERRFVHLLVPGSAVLTLCGVGLMYFGMLPIILYVLIGFGAGLNESVQTDTTDPRIIAVLESNPGIRVLADAPSQPQPGELWLQVRPAMELYCAVADAHGKVEVLTVPRTVKAGVQQQFRLSEYIGFVLMLFFGIVVAFQMPLVILLLGWLGLVDISWFRKNRRYAVFAIAIIAALITPPDIASMMIMLLPMYGLYELGILLLRFAPPAAVAEGRVFRFRFGWRGPDKPSAQSTQVRKTSQTDSVSRRPQPLDQAQVHTVDEKEAES